MTQAVAVAVSNMKCNKCGESKEFTKEFFRVNNRSRTGLEKTCKACCNEAKRLYREANRQKIRESDKDYYRRNKDKVIESKRQYYINNKEKVNKRVNQYRLNNLAQFAMYSQRRRSREAQLPATLTKSEWQNTLKLFNHTCAYCDHDAELEQEHFVALVRGGGYTRENIIPACRSCNGSKSDKCFGDWFRGQGLDGLRRRLTIWSHFKYVQLDECIEVMNQNGGVIDLEDVLSQ